MVISRTPLRISFVGGGSDLKAYYQYAPGAVVSSTIDKYIYAAVSSKYDGLIRVSYSRNEIVKHVDEIEHNIVRSALKLLNLGPGLEIVIISDLPLRNVGTGLGSSSALAVGVLQALHAHRGEEVSPETLAAEACQIEIEMLGHPIGKQDQYAVAHGGFNHIRFNSDGSVAVRAVALAVETRQTLNARLLLFYTGSMVSSHTVLAEQQSKTRDNRGRLEAMARLAYDLPAVLAAADLNRFSEFLNQNWLLKQRLSSTISNNVIDGYYERARLAGAGSGKILGSGGGGFLLLYCERERQNAVREALGELKELPFRFESTGSSIVYRD